MKENGLQKRKERTKKWINKAEGKRKDMKKCLKIENQERFA